MNGPVFRGQSIQNRLFRRGKVTSHPIISNLQDTIHKKEQDRTPSTDFKSVAQNLFGMYPINDIAIASVVGD